MTANTVYVASYHSTGGHYSADWDYFSASGVDNAPRTNGYVTGIRFYKSAGNTGAHVGNLWTSSGILLATAIFTAETAPCTWPPITARRGTIAPTGTTS